MTTRTKAATAAAAVAKLAWSFLAPLLWVGFGMAAFASGAILAFVLLWKTNLPRPWGEEIVPPVGVVGGLLMFVNYCWATRAVSRAVSRRRLRSARPLRPSP